MRHLGVQLNVLLVILAVGAMGPPLLAPLRETFQQQAGLSRAALGWWVFGLSLAGSSFGLFLGVALRNTLRTCSCWSRERRWASPEPCTRSSSRR